MKIALVTSSFLPRVGGAQFVVHNLAVQWARQGHEVCVINCITDQATHAEGLYSVMKYDLLIASTRFGYHRFPFSAYAIRNLKKCLEQFKPDFISAHFGYPVGYWLMKIRPDCNYLVTCHGPAIVDKKGSARDCYNIDGLIADSLNSSDGAVAISSAVRKTMEVMGVKSSKIIDIPNGVDIDRFSKKVNFDLRHYFGIPDDGMIFLSVGRMSIQKGYVQGIESFAKVAPKIKNAYYLLIGREVTGLKGLVESLGISSRVLLHEGLQGEELVGAYRQSNVFFSPSLWELCPLVVLEAMASGLPAVVTDVSGSQDLIIDGENGLVVNAGDIEAMADALLKLSSDSELRKKYGNLNLTRSKSYGWDEISRKYLNYAG